MKAFKILNAALLVSTLLYACKKEEKVVPKPPFNWNGQVSATRNGQSWNANTYALRDTSAGLYDRWAITFGRYSKEEFGDSVLRQYLEFHNLQFKAYTLDIDSVSVMGGTGGHIYKNKQNGLFMTSGTQTETL